VLQSGVLTSRDESVTVDVFNVEQLINGLEAGCSVGLAGNNWEHASIGSLTNFAFLKVAREAIFVGIESETEHVATKSNDSELQVAVDDCYHVLNNQLYSSGARGIDVGRVGLCVGLVLGLVRVVVEHGDHLDGLLAKTFTGNRNSEGRNEAEGGHLDAFFKANGRLDTNRLSLGLS
jgi:hypothetical protein